MKSFLFAISCAAFLTTATASVSVGQDRGPVQSAVENLSRSGLTPEQVRARLRAAGYPDALLDAYLPGGDASRRTLSPDSITNVVRALGLNTVPNDSTRNDSIRIDSTRNDSIRRVVGRDDSAAVIVRPRLSGPDSLPIFGVDLFRRSTSRFQPTLAGSVGPTYRIGPGDVLALILTGDVERALSLDVSRDGFVLIPQVGQVYVANLTLAQADVMIFNRLRRSYGSLGRGPNSAARFYLTVSRLHNNQIFVIGEVRAPGSYQVSSIGTVLTALYAAGGPTDNGTMREVQVRRNGQVVSRIDTYEYLLRGDATGDIVLESGDVVFVGINRGRVSVQGQVIRPARYELNGKETLADVLQMAGGFTTEAAQQRIQVRRILSPEERAPGGRDRVVLDISPSQFQAGLAPPFLLRPGDQIEVFGISSRVRNRLVVTGNVWTPGTVAFTPGMRLSDALRRAGGVKADTYLAEVLISRLESDLTTRSLHAALRDSAGTPVSDILLQDDDEIKVFSLGNFLLSQSVGVTGAVRRPGRFPFRSGMSLRELLLLAGGPVEGADLTKVEIARMPDQPTPGQIARTFRVSLDSTYAPFAVEPARRYGAIRVSQVASQDFTLKPYDNVLIVIQPDWIIPGTVVVNGEVKYPGTYTLTRRNEKISELIRRAGGLAPGADPDAITFARNEQGNFDGRIGVNLRTALADEKSRDNLVLVPGDVLTIGRFQPYVRVTGAVNSPTGVPYVRGADMAYYIAAAGGVTTKGDARRAYVTQPNGSVSAIRRTVFGGGTDPVPRPGSAVVVPEKDPDEKSGFANAITTASTVISGLAVLITLLRR